MTQKTANLLNSYSPGFRYLPTVGHPYAHPIYWLDFRLQDGMEGAAFYRTLVEFPGIPSLLVKGSAIMLIPIRTIHITSTRLPSHPPISSAS